MVARAQLNNAEGRPAGSVSLRQADEGLAVRVRASGLEPGFHGFHVHESGVCDPKARAEGKPMPFASAGPHLSRGGSPHGEHAGDLPPILVGADGTASANVVVRSFSVDELTADDATAFIVHADPDNLANIPDRYAVDGEGGPDAETLETGDSANRVACGKVARTG